MSEGLICSKFYYDDSFQEVFYHLTEPSNGMEENVTSYKFHFQFCDEKD